MMPARRRAAVRAAAAACAAGCVAAWLLVGIPVIAGPALDRSAGLVVEAHSELVASSPGSGEVVATPPTEIRLVFSEPIDPAYTSLDLADSSGTAILSSAGAPDPADPRVLVAAVPAGAIPPTGVATVTWRTLSAADGHTAKGFFTFGVGTVTPGGVAAASESEAGGLHGDHSLGLAIVEIPSKMLGYGGPMLAVGLALLGFLVLRPAARDEAGGDLREAAAPTDDPDGSGQAPAGPGVPVGPGAPAGSGDPGAGPSSGRVPGRRRAGRGSARGNGRRDRTAAAGTSAAPTAVAPPRPGAAARRRAPAAGPATWTFADAYGRLPVAAGWALLAGAAGCLVLIVIAVASLAADGRPADVVGVVTGTRTGQLLAGRLVLGVAGGLAVLALSWARRGGRDRGPALALWVAGAAGLASLVLTAAASHAAAFASPVPMAVDVVHLVAASTWLGGLAFLAAATDFGRGSRFAPGALRAIVPRFSALALVSVAAIALTGAYADWVLTRNPLGTDTAYELSILAKVVVFLVALAIGAVNFLDGGEGRLWLGGLSRRLVIEVGAGIVVLGIAANLTSGSPTAFSRPVAIEPAVGTVTAAVPVTLDLVPGRAGPNRIDAGVIPGPATAAGTASATSAEVVLQRLDLEGGLARIPMRVDTADGSAQPAAAPHFVADAALPDGSRWDATVVVSDAAGSEVSRQRFVFAVDAGGVTEGRATPPVEPGIVLAFILLALGILGFGFGLAGGVLPRTMADASRPALLGASSIGVALAIAIILGGGAP